MVGRHIRCDSSDTSNVLTRARKNLTNNSDKEIQIENKQDSDASKDDSNISAQENKEKQDINCVNNEEAENNKGDSNKDVSSVLQTISKKLSKITTTECLNKLLQKMTKRDKISTLRTLKEKIIAISGCLKRVRNPFREG